MIKLLDSKIIRSTQEQLTNLRVALVHFVKFLHETGQIDKKKEETDPLYVVDVTVKISDEYGYRIVYVVGISGICCKKYGKVIKEEINKYFGDSNSEFIIEQWG